jgi:hypothetical protein
LRQIFLRQKFNTQSTPVESHLAPHDSPTAVIEHFTIVLM